MTKLNSLFFIICLICLLSCKDKQDIKPVAQFATDSIETDSTVYGKCCEGTAMHTLELVTDKGDTVIYSLEGADASADVQGGLFVGDRVAVTGTKDTENNMVATKVINLTSLLGKWVSIDKTFEICEGGAVISNVKEPKPYTEWKIQNGKLLLSADTFDVLSLGADSLYLENDKGIYGFKRFSPEVTQQ